MKQKIDIQKALTERNLKITPQRIAVYKALVDAGDSHPSAEDIYNEVVKNYSAISRTTVYRILDTLVENGLAGKALTKNDIMKYDSVSESHHHLYYEDMDVMKDYKDEELDNILKDYFSRKIINGFEIKKIKLFIEGTTI
jgi:Fur family peroxide stress response transcriptional regulator